MLSTCGHGISKEIKGGRKNFSKVGTEVEARKNILFSSVSSGVTGTGKVKAWRQLTKKKQQACIKKTTTWQRQEDPRHNFHHWQKLCPSILPHLQMVNMTEHRTQ